MKPDLAEPVKLFAGILYSDETLLAQAISLLEKKYGSVDFYSHVFPFEITDYYNAEMGTPIYRIFISFDDLISPSALAEIKLETNRIEMRLAVEDQRRVNLDCGYMDYDKVVLASGKYNGQKIYLDHGIWADLTLHFEKGHFDPYPWSFPDFKSGQYEDVFLEIRRIFKQQRKNKPRQE
jgi:hypothetical protein